MLCLQLGFAAPLTNWGNDMNRILLITLLALLACMKDPPKRTERTPSTDSTPSVCDELTVSEVRMALTLGGDAKNWCNESCVKQHCKDNEHTLLVLCKARLAKDRDFAKRTYKGDVIKFVIINEGLAKVEET